MWRLSTWWLEHDMADIGVEPRISLVQDAISWPLEMFIKNCYLTSKNIWSDIDKVQFSN